MASYRDFSCVDYTEALRCWSRAPVNALTRCHPPSGNAALETAAVSGARVFGSHRVETRSSSHPRLPRREGYESARTPLGKSLTVPQLFTNRAARFQPSEHDQPELLDALPELRRSF